MSLPQAVQQQLEEADRLVAQINGEGPENGDLLANTATERTPAEPQQQFSEPTPPAEEPWEQRYRSLKGMYDADVPRLHAQTRELNTQVQVLSNEIEQVRQVKIEQREKASITDEDREAFGPDLISLIERAAEGKVETLRNREAELVGEITQLKSQLGELDTRQNVSDKDRFLTNLTGAAPGWAALNTNQGFLTWLAEVDPVYGIPRQYALNSAYESFDVSRVAAIFNSYSSTIAPTTPQPSNRQQLRNQVAPSRSRSSAQPTESQNSKIYTNQEIEEFYGNWRRGMFNNDDAVRTESDIHAAIAEGRIR